VNLHYGRGQQDSPALNCLVLGVSRYRPEKGEGTICVPLLREEFCLLERLFRQASQRRGPLD
jgi:hypothetical protein